MAIAISCCAAFPLVLVHNREEEFSREATDVQQDDSGIVAAWDKEAGGTWMGLHAKSGRLMALTNVRTKHLPPVDRASRGKMVKDYLAGLPAEPKDSFFAYHSFLVEDAFSTSQGFWFQSSTPEPSDSGVEWSTRREPIPVGVVSGCSNEIASNLGEDMWPKTRWLVDQVGRILHQQGENRSQEEESMHDLLNRLGEVLSMVVEFEQDQLPDLSFTPLDKAEEARRQRGPFIPGVKGYGTQCQTVVLRSAEKNTLYYCYRRTINVPGSELGHVPWTIHRIHH